MSAWPTWSYLPKIASRSMAQRKARRSPTSRPGSTPGAHGYSQCRPGNERGIHRFGPGIKRGVKLGSVRNLDVAPTIAKLLGLEMKNIQGKVLTEALA